MAGPKSQHGSGLPSEKNGVASRFRLGVLCVEYVVVWSLRESLGPLLPKKPVKSCKMKPKGSLIRGMVR